MFKRIVLATLAATVAFVPLANAQNRNDHDNRRIERQYNQPRHVAPKRFDRPAVGGHRVVRKPQWVRGHKMPNWQRQQAVRDWQRHGLRRPGNGQRWVRVGNDYILIGALTGLIAGIIASR